MNTSIFAIFIFFIGILSAETYVSGEVSGVWDISGSPYYVIDTVFIPVADSLRIMPGCSVIFLGHYKLAVDSAAILKAIGNEIDSIIITAADTIEGHHRIKFFKSANCCSIAYCIIEYGNAYGDCSFDRMGGGIFCEFCDATIINSTIAKNRAVEEGGGIFLAFSSANIVKNRIHSNRSAFGGGISSGLHDGMIKHNLIHNNHAYIGAGICCSNSIAIISNNIIFGNSADYLGGAFMIEEGDPYSTHRLLILNNIIFNNYAHMGGGIQIGLHPNVLFLNNLIFSNTADSAGGAIKAWSSSNIILENNTICDNSAPIGGALAFRDSPKVVLFNTIIYGNISLANGGEIYIDSPYHYISNLYISYTLLDTNSCIIETTTCTITYGPGIFYTDPLFYDTLYYLSEISPCINTGAESIYIPAWDTVICAPVFDIDSFPRPWNDAWDIGAYEWHSDLIDEYIYKPRSTQISAYPNPFNSSCAITVNVGDACMRPAKVEIYDLRGRVVCTHGVGARHSHKPATFNEQASGNASPSQNGARTFIWHPNESITSGIYLIRATSNNRTTTKRVVLMK